MFENIDWKGPDNVRRQIIAISDMVAKNERYQNDMRNFDNQKARMESGRVLQQVSFSVMANNMKLFKQIRDNLFFKKFLSDTIFNMTYDPKNVSRIVKYLQTETNTSMSYGTEKE